jgi:hypothetical protein
MHVGTRYTELLFFHPVGYVSHVLHSSASGALSVDTPFFMLGWNWYGFHKICVGTRYAKLVFLHLVGSIGHIMHSGTSRSQNIDALLQLANMDTIRSVQRQTTREPHAPYHIKDPPPLLPLQARVRETAYLEN